MPLAHLQSRFGFPDPIWSGSAVTFKSQYTTMVLEANSRKLIMNGVLIWLNGPLVKNGSSWGVTQTDFDAIIDPLLRTGPTLATAGSSMVVLDPGHGGIDSGAIGGRRVFEKKVVLDIAKRVREKLQSSHIKVRMTRETDVTLSLRDRTDRADRWAADLFVSIHLNSAHNRQATGVETYTVSAPGYPSTSPGRIESKRFAGNHHDARNTILAHYVHKGLLNQTKGFDRGIKHARFDVLTTAPCPAILVECGFVSNATEEAKIIQASHRDRIAEGISRGILTYISRARSGS